MKKNNAIFVTTKIDDSLVNAESWTASSKRDVSKSPSTSTISNTVTNSTLPSIQLDKVPTVFEWKGEHKAVFITGSFCNWKQRLKMNYLQTSSRLILGLAPGRYQYKYIVDGEWLCSKDYPTVTEQGIVNNVIEVISKPGKGKELAELEQSLKKSTPIERAVIPCPDLNMTPLPLCGNCRALPQVLSNHAFIPCASTIDMTHIAIFSTNRVRMKTVAFVYYKPRRST